MLIILLAKWKYKSNTHLTTEIDISSVFQQALCDDTEPFLTGPH